METITTPLERTCAGAVDRQEFGHMLIYSQLSQHQVQIFTRAYLEQAEDCETFYLLGKCAPLSVCALQIKSLLSNRYYQFVIINSLLSIRYYQFVIIKSLLSNRYYQIVFCTHQHPAHAMPVPTILPKAREIRELP